MSNVNFDTIESLKRPDVENQFLKQASGSLMERFLIKTHLAKNKRRAKAILVVIAVSGLFITFYPYINKLRFYFETDGQRQIRIINNANQFNGI